MNKVFSEPGGGDTGPFKEFHPQSNKMLDNLLQKIADIGHKNSKSITQAVPPETDEQGLKSAVMFTLQSITQRHMSPGLVKLALGIYLTHSDEAKQLGVRVPPLKEHSEFKNPIKQTHKQPLSNPVTADTMKGVGIAAYFREDYDINEHHWHWHLIYPYAGIGDTSKRHRTIERQGELFLYIHGQMIARYNAETLSWGFNRTLPWSYDDIIPFGYTPVPGLRATYGARPPDRGWSDNKTLFSLKEELTQWRDNILQSIEDGFFHTTAVDRMGITKSGKLMLTPENAMNWVGIVVEAQNEDLQEVSPNEYINRTMYGTLHNTGHAKFAEIGYKEYTSKQNPLGVMITNIGSLRDPCFWLWHTHIDEFRNVVVNKYNHSLDEFAPQAEIIQLEIMPQSPYSETPKSGVTTILGPPRLELNEANAKIDHEPYKWKVTVQSTRNPPPSRTNPQAFTVRIFITPKKYMEDQRSWMEMDKFTHILTHPTDTITRLDIDSSVARKSEISCKSGNIKNCKQMCGWPQNMMLPNGMPEGIDYVGFAMLTDDKLSDVSCTSKHDWDIMK